MAESVNSNPAGEKPVNKPKSLPLQINVYLKKINKTDDSNTLRLSRLAEQTLQNLEKCVVNEIEKTDIKIINTLNQMITSMKKNAKQI